MKDILLGIVSGVICFIGWVAVSILLGLNEGAKSLGAPLTPLRGELVFWVLLYAFGLGMFFLPGFFFVKACIGFLRWITRKRKLRYLRYMDHDYKD